MSRNYNGIKENMRHQSILNDHMSVECQVIFSLIWIFAEWESFVNKSFLQKCTVSSNEMYITVELYRTLAKNSNGNMIDQNTECEWKLRGFSGQSSNLIFYSIRVRHGSDSSGSACCTAGPSSNLGSAPRRRPFTERKAMRTTRVVLYE